MRPTARRSLLTLVSLVWLGAVPATAHAQTLLRGRLIDSLRTGRPIAGGEVVHLGTGERVTTDRRGRFEFNGLPAGQHRLAYWAPWLDSVALPAVEKMVEIAAGSRTVEVALAIPSAARVGQGFCGTAYDAAFGILVGEVRTPGGEPLAGVPVEARWTETILAPGTHEKREVSARDLTSESGLFTLCGVPATVDFNLRGSTERGATGDLLVNLRNQPIIRRDLIVTDDSAQATVRGRVIGPDGRPLVNAQVVLVGDGAAATAGADGRFTLRRTPQRSSQLLVRSIGFDPRTVDVDPRGDLVDLGDVPLVKSVYSLPQVDINGRLMSREQLGFEHRKKMGLGRFLDEAELNTVPLPSRAALLHMVTPRSRYVCRDARGCAFVMIGPFGHCIPDLFVDGMRASLIGSAVEDQQAWLLRAVRVEIYRATTVPPEFATADGSCGALVIWTR
jgi:hypothetical protein